MSRHDTITRTAGRALADTLVAGGATRGFCVPGESYLGLLDALRDLPGFDLVTSRHEGGAGFMAVADARLTGLPGIVMVSRGPGVGNVLIAAHVAEQDGIPLLLLIGQVPRDVRHRDAFQEVDYSRLFSGVAKRVVEVTDPHRIAEFTALAWHTAMSGRPGPVVLSLPEDMLLEPSVSLPVVPQVPARPHADETALAQIAALIAQAERPLLIAGEALATNESRSALLSFAQVWGVPVLCGHKSQDLFPNASPLWAGHIGHVVPEAQARLWASADLVIAAGSILGDVETQGYSFPAFPMPEQPLIQIHHDPGQLGRHYRPTLAVCADAATTLARLTRAPVETRIAADWAKDLHAHAAPSLEERTKVGGYAQAIIALDRLAAPDCIVTMDSGRFASSAHRCFRYGGDRLLLGTASGAMGNAVPAAVAAARRNPGRQVIAIVGDGGLLMTGNELATAIHHDCDIRILVANNGGYGAIAAHQNRLFPGRIHAMSLSNPDFPAWAESFGAKGLRIGPADDIERVMEEFLAGKGPKLLEVACE